LDKEAYGGFISEATGLLDFQQHLSSQKKAASFAIEVFYSIF